jgi:predicted ATPase/DNA-binding CsgD family transcriptional regulator
VLGASQVHNLTAPLTSFVGRDHEITHVKALLSSTRLLTLQGAGGIGKTRLALEVAASLVDEYRDGVWVVELASLSDEALVPQAVASVMGLLEEPGQPYERTLAHALHDRRLLLVVDNCEHLVDACARLVAGLLQACPALRVLATSREALEIDGEVTWSVPPLSLPEPPPQTAGCVAAWLDEAEAARLFVARASTAQPAFVLRDEDVATLSEICSRLDCMPLAIELAAARVKVMGLQQIAARLADRLRLLKRPSRTVPARHQSLRAAIEWSYGLLPAAERELFDRLAIFAGGWKLEAAEAVGANAETEVLELLDRLVEKSLVVAEPTPDGGVRHRLLETLREFAHEQLVARGDLATTRAAHAAYFAGLAEEATRELSGPTQRRWLEHLDAERDNLRAVLEWSLEPGDGAVALAMGANLWSYWERRGDFSEGRAWLRRALQRTQSTASADLRAAGLHGAGHLAWRQRDLEESERLHTEALALSRAQADECGVARSLYGLARVAGSRGDHPAALTFAQDSLAIQRRLGNHNDVALVLNVLGEIARSRGDYERAAALYGESLALFRQTGEVLGIQIELHNLGYVARRQGDESGAASLFGESLELSRNFGIRMGVASCIGGLAGAAVAARRPLEAAQLFGAAEALREAIAFPMEVIDHAELDRDVAALRTMLDGRALSAAWARGCGMTIEAAIEASLAFAQPGALGPVDAEPQRSPLTAREQAVAALIARGLTNRQIADRLGISKLTVDRHVSNILNKLDMATRAQVASWFAATRQPQD